MVLNHKEVTAFALKNLEKEKNSEFYPPLERIERKLDAIIDWINWFAKENRVSGDYEATAFEGSFKTLPTIDLEDCERRDKDSE